MTDVAAAPLTLDQHLGRCYHARVGTVKIGAPEMDFVKALRADPELANAARERLQSIPDDPLFLDRCFVTKIHRAVLTAALANLENP